MTYTTLATKIPESLHRQLKRQAVEERRPMSKIVEELLQKYLTN